MATVSPQLRTIAQTAFEALNSGDLDAYLSVIAEDVEFTSIDRPRLVPGRRPPSATAS